MTVCLFGENAPCWMCLSAPGFATREYYSLTREPTLEELEAKRLATEAREAARQAALELAREASRKANAVKKAETKRLRAERSKANKAARRALNAKPPISREERIARIRAGVARARAEGRLPGVKAGPRKPKRPPSKLIIAPDGMISAADAAKMLKIHPTAITRAVTKGGLANVRQGRFCFVWADEIRAYFEARQAPDWRIESLAKARAARWKNHGQA